MPEPKPERVRVRRRAWRPWLIGVGVSLTVVISVAVAIHAYTRHLANERLREAIEAVDRVDPRWRLEEIEEDRAVIPDEKNGALRALAAAQALPKRRVVPRIEPDWKLLPASQMLDPQLTTTLREERNKHAAALSLAREMMDFDRGRYPITYAPDYFSTLLPHGNQARDVGWLLEVDIALLAQDGDIPAALRSCRALVNLARSFGDEPISITQLARIALVVNACRGIERALAQGEATDADLNALQSLLQAEDGERFFPLACRGERAGFHRLAEAVEAGSVSLRTAGESREPLSPGWRERVTAELSGSMLRRDHARMLEFMTEFVEIANLPPHQRAPRFAAIKMALEPEKKVFTRLMPAMDKVAEAVQRHRTNVRTTQIALAAERFRTKHGRWPISAEALVPRYLPSVPPDPYTGHPLKFLWQDGGVVVYSVGADGTDDLGTFNRSQPTAPGTDVGFQLWPVRQRRQPAPEKPAPPPRPPEPEGG